jgi:hypothetical protein
MVSGGGCLKPETIEPETHVSIPETSEIHSPTCSHQPNSQKVPNFGRSFRLSHH